MSVEEKMANVRSREGHECIYREGQLICAARLDKVRVDAQRMQADLTPIPVPGLDAPNQAWTIGATWSILTCAPDAWMAAAMGGSWRLYFEDRVVRAVKEIAPTLAQADESDKFPRLLECLG